MAKARKINAYSMELSEEESTYIRKQIEEALVRTGIGVQGKSTDDMLREITASVCDAFETFIIYEASP